VGATHHEHRGTTPGKGGAVAQGDVMR